MPQFRIIPATRSTANEVKHGWAVERSEVGQVPRVVSILFLTSAEAELEALRLAKLESDMLG